MGTHCGRVKRRERSPQRQSVVPGYDENRDFRIYWILSFVHGAQQKGADVTARAFNYPRQESERLFAAARLAILTAFAHRLQPLFAAFGALGRAFN